MSFIGTAVDWLGDALGGVTDVFQTFGSLVEPAVQLGTATGILPQPQRRAGPPVSNNPYQTAMPTYRPAVYTGPTAMPGGASTMPYMPTAQPVSLGGAVLRQLPGLIGGAGIGAGLDWLGGGNTVSTDIPLTSSGRLPRTFNTFGPTGQVETYVKAPRVNFKVTVSRRRRCRGGR